MNILVINGPNINTLGKREPDIYGQMTYDDLTAYIAKHARLLGVGCAFFQSNSEGAIIDTIQTADMYDGIIINPAAYTHYSYAIHDALKACSVPAVEVHLTNIAAREEFRQRSVTASACVGSIAGLGAFGYVAAIEFLVGRVR